MRSRTHNQTNNRKLLHRSNALTWRGIATYTAIAYTGALFITFIDALFFETSASVISPAYDATVDAIRVKLHGPDAEDRGLAYTSFRLVSL